MIHQLKIKSKGIPSFLSIYNHKNIVYIKKVLKKEISCYILLRIDYNNGVDKIMASISVVAKHSKGKKEEDLIFGVNALANERAKIVGKENIINASIGAFLDGNGTLVTFPTVEKVIKEIPFVDSANYAPIAGIPDYTDAAIDFTFEEFRPKNMHIKALSTPGGTGAIHHAIWNYTEEGDKVLTSDWFWGPYSTMAKEMGRDLSLFRLFDDKKEFDIKDFFLKADELFEKQKNVLALVNSPAHNPTGFSLTYEDWQNLVEEGKKRTEGKDKNFILFVDIAYIDFAPEGSRRFFELFTDLPANFLIIVGFSMSKSYTMYGYRTGAMIAVSSSEEVINEFYDSNQYSCRGTWSNCTRGGQLALIKLWKDKSLKDKLFAERSEYRDRLAARAKIFLDEAEEVDLETCPYHSGFFITVPVANAAEVATKLTEDNLFLVPLKRGLRIAICAIPSSRIKGMATLIKKAVVAVNK